MYGHAYTRYQAQCWADGKSSEEIRNEIAAVEHKARTHQFKWNEVGNVSDTWCRADTLRAILSGQVLTS